MVLGIVGNRGVSFGQCANIICQNIQALTPELVVSGGARGVDSHAVRVAKALGVPVREFLPVGLSTIGKAAYFKRNREIARASDVLLCIYTGCAPVGGTAYTQRFASGLGVRVVPVFLGLL